jgi:antitoxin FitA
MGDMLIRGMPAPLKRDIEAAARKSGKSLSATAIDLLRKGMVTETTSAHRSQSAWDEIRAVFVAEDAVDGSFSSLMEEIESERKNDFGRPPEEMA